MNCPKCNKPAGKNGTREGVQQYACFRCPENAYKHFYFREGQTETRQPKEPQVETKPLKMGISENQFRAKHDVKYQVEQAVKTLQKGAFLTTPEFVQSAKIRQGQGYKNFIEHPDFEDYRGRAGSVVYWSHPDSIKKLKEEGLLQ